MNPIYKFTLAANGGAEQQAFPVYRDDLAKDFELQTNQEFYRAKLSGKLTFVRDDYDFIANKSFETQFDVKIYISYDAGETWAEYWHGQFWKTDCAFNAEDKNVTLTPTVIDQYTNVLAGLEKEYNLIDLAPQIIPINLDKRPMIQVYVPGQTVIGCFLSGMWWEQQCEAVNETDRVTIDGQNYPALTHKYHFDKNKTIRIGDVSGSMTPQLPDILTATNPAGFDTSLSGGGFTLVIYYNESDPEAGAFWEFSLKRTGENPVLWYYKTFAAIGNIPYSVTLTPVEGSGATGNVTIYVHDVPVYARYICDVESAAGLNTYPIPDDDLVENNRNYSRVIGYEFPNTIIFSTLLVSTPTKWGIYEPGQYYYSPADVPSYGLDTAFPVARAAWGRVSIWFVQDLFDFAAEEKFRKQYTLRDAYPLASVISVLLAQVAPGITHAETTDYSIFLYGTNPLTNINQRIFITQKSNMLALGYDQPAQKAPITLKRVLDMLRDCFRCYWFIDEQNRFRIEHISYFMRGGTYTGTPVIGRDLTNEKVTRNNKEWAFGTSKFQFDKPEMAARYQFGWMDDVTEPFEGNPIDIISKYVNPDNIEQIDVSQFTSDVDYILLNPGEISKDGFVLLGAKENIATPTVTLGSTTWNIDYRFEAGQTYMVKLVGGNLAVRSFSVGSEPLVALQRDQWVEERPTQSGNPYVYFGSGNPGDMPVIQIMIKGDIRLPYLELSLNERIQNGYMAFIFLQQYYFYDMPARYFTYNGIYSQALGIKKLKTQTLKFPALNDPNTLQLIKTNLGNGTIQKMSVNLSSRTANATLKYDTE